jgi:heme-degrading monooxygenase HmoA
MTTSGDIVCIFSSTRRVDHRELYETWASKMDELVQTVPGYLRHTTVSDEATHRAITVSYFDSLESLQQWREVQEHQNAQKLGRDHFYEEYRVDIAAVTRSYGWSAGDLTSHATIE